MTDPTTLASPSTIDDYQQRKVAVAAALAHHDEPVYLRKGTSSNLFRYGRRQRRTGKAVSLKDFNHTLALDPVAGTLDVEGLTTYQNVVSWCLNKGFLPTVAPELKHITVGGATVGIGIESSGHRHGFVHDGLLEADVLLPGGEVVTCSPDNEYADLFHGLPNSYGTLGYILRARIRVVPAKPFVRLRNHRFDDIGVYLDSMESAAREHRAEFIDGLFYSRQEQYLTLADMIDQPGDLDGIYGRSIFHRTLRERAQMLLRTEDYIFRYDPDWFWNIPETAPYQWFRRLAPRAMRSSGFYNRYVATKYRLMGRLGIEPDRSQEQLIQDWEVPWAKAGELVELALGQVDLQGQPWVALPIRSQGNATLYPLQPNILYFNLGCYCYTKRPREDVDYHYTRLLDAKCFELGGLKMLYSTSFLDQGSFDRLYAGEAYRVLKKRYDPGARAPTLFEKTVLAR